MPEYAKKVDANHAEIREYIRNLGYVWTDTFRNGDGFPDAEVIAKNGMIVQFEIKSPGGRLNKNEKEYFYRLLDAGYTFYFVVLSPQDARMALDVAEHYEIVLKKT